MSEDKIPNIETVSMREQFENEEHDFTPWLRDNIKRLKSEDLLNIDFDEVEKEKTVIDNKKIDIVAKDTENNLKAIIENQFEESDSDHLGRSLVYASDLDADLVVWIAENFLERHKNTIRWLNTTTDDDTFYFAIEVNLRQISDSPYAVEFQAHERPENWEERVEEEYLEDKAKRRLKFWREFQQECENRGIEGSEPNHKASHSIYVFKGRKRPAYIRPTVKYSGSPKNMVRFYEESKDILRKEENKEKFIDIIEKSVSELDVNLTKQLADAVITDIDDDNDFDKLIIENDNIEHQKLSNGQEVEKALQWMVDTTLVLQNTLINLSEEEIEAEPR
jgi:hypothetical protein